MFVKTARAGRDWQNDPRHLPPKSEAPGEKFRRAPNKFTE
jgi:hypothetical protein